MPRTILTLLLTIVFIPSVSAGSGGCAEDRDTSIPRVDMQKMERAWFGWVNRYRRRLKLAPYTSNRALHGTALEWSKQAAPRGSIDHKRSPEAAYYDYQAIEQWFADHGLTFTNVNRATFTENVGWGTYRCAQQDCTASLIRSIRSTFRFYMSERNKESKPHYASITHPDFTQMGLGLAVNEEKGRYYLTVHYATVVTAPLSSDCAAQ